MMIFQIYMILYARNLRMMRLALQLFVFVGIVFNKNQALEMNAWVNFDSKYEYNYLSSNASREEARRTCSDIGAIMLELRNVEQLNFYEKTFQNINAWVGLKQMSNTWVWESTMEPLVGDPFNGFWACLDRVAVNTANKSLEYTNVNYAYFDFELHGMVDQGPNYVGPSIICLRKIGTTTISSSRTNLMISSSGILSSIIFSTQQKSASATKPQFLASDWEAYGETSMEYQIFNPTGMSSYQEYQTFCRSQSGALPILLTNESFQEFKKIIKVVTFLGISRSSDGLSWYWDDDNKTKLSYAGDFFYCTPDADQAMSSAVFNPKLEGGFAVDVQPRFSVNSSVCIRNKAFTTTSGTTIYSTASFVGNTTVNGASTSFSTQPTLEYSTSGETNDLMTITEFTESSSGLSSIGSNTSIYNSNSSAIATTISALSDSSYKTSQKDTPIDSSTVEGRLSTGISTNAKTASFTATSEAAILSSVHSSKSTTTEGSSKENSFSNKQSATSSVTKLSRIISSTINVSTGVKTDNVSSSSSKRYGYYARYSESQTTTNGVTNMAPNTVTDTTSQPTGTFAASSNAIDKISLQLKSSDDPLSTQTTSSTQASSSSNATGIAGRTSNGKSGIMTSKSSNQKLTALTTSVDTTVKSPLPAEAIGTFSQKSATTTTSVPPGKPGNYSRWVGKFKNVALEANVEMNNLIAIREAGSKRKCLEYCMKDAACSIVQVSSDTIKNGQIQCQLLKESRLSNFILNLKADHGSDVYRLF